MRMWLRNSRAAGPVWFDAIYVFMTGSHLQSLAKLASFNLIFSYYFAGVSRADTPDEDIAVHLTHSAQTEWVLTVRFHNGFTLNSRVPESQRLQLVGAEQSWEAGDFVLQPGVATLYIDEAAPYRAKLTAYICRPGHCKKVTVPVKTTPSPLKTK